MDEQLGAVLAVLVARTGARAARVVDARGGGVLAQAGVVPAADIRALVALARDVVPSAGRADDLVLSTPDGVHVLRTFPRAFVHLRVGAGPAVAAARRELASPALRDAVENALSRPAAPHLPGRRRPPLGPVEPRHDQPVRQPALAVLGAPAGRTTPAGSLAVLALAPGPAPVTLPQRSVAAAATRPHPAGARPLALPAVLRQEWAGDAATMGRLLDGLRRLN